MIDTHCHLTFPKLYDRLDEVLSGAADDGVDRMITVGTTPDDAKTARSLARSYRQIYFSVGVHPHEADGVALNELPRLFELAMDRRCAAVGEMGLDYHYDVPRQAQQELFQAQLELIRDSDLSKPIIIHCREALDDTIATIQSARVDGERFVFHCFSGGPDEARKVLDLGAMVSFTGIATYKNAPEVREAAKLVPNQRLMLETDAPYLSPEPHRKVRPNEPRYVVATARFLSELRGVSVETLIEQSDQNAKRFFHLID